MDSKWQLRVVEQMQEGAIEIFIFREVAGGKIQYVSNLSGDAGMELTTMDRGARLKPCMVLEWGNQQFLQAISNGLFNFGIRPEQEPILKNELTATKYHLEDMRELIFKQKGGCGGDKPDTG